MGTSVEVIAPKLPTGVMDDVRVKSRIFIFTKKEAFRKTK